jgi:hypothetical protein
MAPAADQLTALNEDLDAVIPEIGSEDRAGPGLDRNTVRGEELAVGTSLAAP